MKSKEIALTVDDNIIEDGGVMKFISFWLCAGLMIVGLPACSSLGGLTANDKLEQQDKTMRVDAYGRFKDKENMTVNQRWSLAQQAAKLDAYRDFSDQLYKEPLDGQKTIGTQVMVNDAYRVYLDTYLRDARAIDYHMVNDQLKLTMELHLTSRFYRCMSGGTEIVNQCLLEDKKLALTRLGNNAATTTTVNLACGVSDCSDQLHVQGFSKERNAVDNVLLNVGLYDTEWHAHTAASLFARVFFIHELINGF